MRIGVALALWRRRRPGDRAGRVQHGGDACVGRLRRSRPTTSRCTRSGAAPTACRGSCWRPSARSSRATGAIPAPSCRTRAACSARCSSRPAPTRPRGASTPPATRASAARGASGASRPGIRRTAWTTPTTRSRRRRPSSPTTPATARLWPRALWRYNALHSYRKTVLRRAARLGMNSACGLLRVRAGLARGRPPARRRAPADARRSDSRALAATPASLLADDSIAFAPAAADDIAHGVADKRLVALLAWIAQRHGIVVSDRPHRATPATSPARTRNRTTGTAARPRSARSTARPVAPGSHAAAALWKELLTAPKALRPDEIGAPWSSPANPRWFTGPDEQATLHVGFDAVGAKKG